MFPFLSSIPKLYLFVIGIVIIGIIYLVVSNMNKPVKQPVKEPMNTPDTTPPVSDPSVNIDYSGISDYITKNSIAGSSLKYVIDSNPAVDITPFPGTKIDIPFNGTKLQILYQVDKTTMMNTIENPKGTILVNTDGKLLTLS